MWEGVFQDGRGGVGMTFLARGMGVILSYRARCPFRTLTLSFECAKLHMLFKHRRPTDYQRFPQNQKEDTTMEWYLKVVKDNYANAKGRARRKEYWMFVLFNFIFAVAAFIIDNILGSFPLIYMLYCLAIIVPGIAVSIRRLHDIGKSGWWFLICLIPIAGGIWFLVLVCTDGTPGENSYGPSPKAA